MLPQYDIIFLIFGCDTKYKYRNQIIKLEETWGKKAREYNNIKLLFFLGEREVLKGPEYIHLPNVENDYLSASYKQWYGIKYIYEKYKPNFVFIVGTDTFVNIPKLLSIITKYDHTKRLYIGGHGEERRIKNEMVYYHDGGAGYLISYPCLQYIYSKTKDVEKYMAFWKNICNESDCTDLSYNTAQHLIPACDVSVGYLISTAKIKITTIKLDEHFFQCNYIGRNCHRKLVDQQNIIACHKMTSNSINKFHNILENNNYYT